MVHMGITDGFGDFEEAQWLSLTGMKPLQEASKPQ
jgi:hypothetical protein